MEETGNVVDIDFLLPNQVKQEIQGALEDLKLDLIGLISRLQILGHSVSLHELRHSDVQTFRRSDVQTFSQEYSSFIA